MMQESIPQETEFRYQAPLMAVASLFMITELQQRRREETDQKLTRIEIQQLLL